MLRVLYRLERTYGTEAYFIKLTPGTYKADWGKHQNEVRVASKIYRLVVFEATNKFKFDHLNFPTDFKYGGHFEIGDKVVIWKTNQIIDENDYFVIGGKRYAVKKKIDLDFEVGYVLHLSETVNRERQGVFNVTVSQGIDISQEISDA